MENDIIDNRLPGLFGIRLPFPDADRRARLADQLAEIDAHLGDELPSEAWIETAEDVEILALCMRFYRQKGVPDALLKRVDQLSRKPNHLKTLFETVREGLDVHVH